MDGHIPLFHLQGLKILPKKLKFAPFLEHLEKFQLDLRSLRYSNSPQVSCLGRNPGRGWNPNLEESYLLEYRESEAETWTQCTSGIYLQPNPSPISEYSESTKTDQSQYFRVFQARGQTRV